MACRMSKKSDFYCAPAFRQRYIELQRLFSRLCHQKIAAKGQLLILLEFASAVFLLLRDNIWRLM